MFLSFLLSVVFILAFYNCYWKRRKLPPGPMPLPLLGNLHQIGAESPGTAAMERFAKEYGPVFTYWLGETPFVAFADFETIEKTLGDDADCYTDREFFGDFYTSIRGLCPSPSAHNPFGSSFRRCRRHLQSAIKRLEGAPPLHSALNEAGGHRDGRIRGEDS